MHYITTHDAPATHLRGRGDSTWQQHAACRDMNPKTADAIFFPTERNLTAITQAKATCARCPIRETCLNAALDTGTREGIWGGRTEAERRPLHDKAARRLEHRRVLAVIAGRDIPLSTPERKALAREAAQRGWSPQRLATVLGFTVKHARDLLGRARHELQQTDTGVPKSLPRIEQQDTDAPEEMTSGAEQFDALDGPTDAELTEQAA